MNEMSRLKEEAERMLTFFLQVYVGCVCYKAYGKHQMRSRGVYREGKNVGQKDLRKM